MDINEMIELSLNHILSFHYDTDNIIDSDMLFYYLSAEIKQMCLEYGVTEEVLNGLERALKCI